MRSPVDYTTRSKIAYNDFIKKNPKAEISFEKWLNLIYSFNEMFRDHILETGDKEKLPLGFGNFTINKRIRKKIKIVDGVERINLPIDWVKTKQKGKVIYNFNHHTEGYFFGWVWFRNTARFKYSDLFYFKPNRCSSRLIAHYLKTDKKYQDIYKEWSV